MLQLATKPTLYHSLRTLRFFSQAAVTRVALPRASKVQHPYYVPRNTRGNLPVYTDVRNAGSRYLVLIQNVDGNPQVLAKDLQHSLFKPDSPEASRLQINIRNSKNLVISGGRWKNHILEWLKTRGF